MNFEAFPKIPRLSRDCVITEKLDGTNACVIVTESGEVFSQSRSRIITPEEDNYGFARWVKDNTEELIKLGHGHHFGEWWGAGIQRRYGLSEKRFSLFNVARWSDDSVRPACCYVVPTLYTGPFDTDSISWEIEKLTKGGSVASPGFMDPEGIIIYHTAAKQYFKKTISKDSERKNYLRS